MASSQGLWGWISKTLTLGPISKDSKDVGAISQKTLKTLGSYLNRLETLRDQTSKDSQDLGPYLKRLRTFWDQISKGSNQTSQTLGTFGKLRDQIKTLEALGSINIETHGARSKHN